MEQDFELGGFDEVLWKIKFSQRQVLGGWTIQRCDFFVDYKKKSDTMNFLFNVSTGHPRSILNSEQLKQGVRKFTGHRRQLRLKINGTCFLWLLFNFFFKIYPTLVGVQRYMTSKWRQWPACPNYRWNEKCGHIPLEIEFHNWDFMYWDLMSRIELWKSYSPTTSVKNHWFWWINGRIDVKT